MCLNSLQFKFTNFSIRWSIRIYFISCILIENTYFVVVFVFSSYIQTEYKMSKVCFHSLNVYVLAFFRESRGKVSCLYVTEQRGFWQQEEAVANRSKLHGTHLHGKLCWGESKDICISQMLLATGCWAFWCLFSKTGLNNHFIFRPLRWRIGVSKQIWCYTAPILNTVQGSRNKWEWSVACASWFSSQREIFKKCSCQ